jgi:ATP-binding cassette subfamily B protein
MRLSQIRNSTTEKAEVVKLRPLLPYLYPYKNYIIGAVVALIITSSSVLGLGKGMGYLIDEGIGGNNPNLLNIALMILILITALLAVGTYARFFLITYAGERVIADIRRDIYQHILNMSPEFFEKTKAGDILSRITIDTTLLQAVVGSSLSVALRNTLMLIGGTALLIQTSPKLALIVAVVVPIVVVPIIILGRKLRILSKDYQDKIATISSHAEESINGIKTIQAFVREGLENKLFAGDVDESLKSALKRIRLRSLLTAIVIMFVFGAVAFVLWIGGHDVLSGQMSPGKLSSFIFYSVLVAGATGSISEVVGDLQRAAGAAERISELFCTEPSVKETIAPVKMPKKIKGDIGFDNVTFTYPSHPEKASLKNFSLDIKSGETIALVGHSGAGKSTVFQLLLRFYESLHGEIKIDSINIADLKLKDLRGLFGLVPQDPVIFSNSAYNNILFGNPEADENAVKKAAKAAAATEFIEDLSEGFDTFLGEKGVRISGGEKQRIAIARTFLKDPKILLLDEATSALDIENEKIVQKAFHDLMKNRTTIVIAHRLSTVQKADRIVVMDNGEIKEIGSHDDLIKKKGLYAKLVKSSGQWSEFSSQD